MSLSPQPARALKHVKELRFGGDLFVALIVFSFPHGFSTARDIRKRSEVQHISPLIPTSSVKHRGGVGVGVGRLASERGLKEDEQ